MIYLNKKIKKQQKYFQFLFFNILFNLSVQDWVFKPENNKQLNEQERKDFTGFKLLRLNPRTELQINWLRSLYSSDTNSAPPFFNLDFWQPPTHIGALVDLTVSPVDAPAFFGELRHKELDYLVIADNLEDLIKKERNNNQNKEYLLLNDEQKEDKFWFGKAKPKEPEYRYDRYNPLTRMEEHLFRLREMNPKLISLYEIGKTHENRSIVTAKISTRKIMPDENWRPFRGPAIWIDAGIHAREWIGPATAMILIAALINGYNSEDVEIQQLVDNIDWYITPVLNPDGYEYSHTKNRMWRKNRRPAFCKQQYFNKICCSGVDLNRNFDWFWSITGSSSDPCHETYHGPSAFSEPEKSVRDFLQGHPVKAFISLHSYSQLWLLPYGHKKRNYPEDFHTVQRPLALKAIKALQRLYGTEYQVGSGADLLYEASGSSHDYAKGVHNIPFSFLVELRPQNTLHSTGFLLPEAEIMDTADETWEAIKVVSDKILEKYSPLLPIEAKKGKNIMGSSNEIEGNEHCLSSITSTSTTTTTTISSLLNNNITLKTTIKPTPRRKNKILNNNKTTKTINNNSTLLLLINNTTKIETTTPIMIITTSKIPTTKEILTSSSSLSSSSNSSIRNSIINKLENLIPWTSIESKNKIRSKNNKGGIKKTIVNVKICTGGINRKRNNWETLLTFPPQNKNKYSSSEEEEEEDIEEEIPNNNEKNRKSREQNNNNNSNEEEKENINERKEMSTTSKLIKCYDNSIYCKWWRMHGICTDLRIRRLCTLSCTIECQI